MESDHPQPPPGWRIDTRSIHVDAVKFDLSLHLADNGETLDGFFEYDAALFDPGTIVRMEGHFRVLLKAAADPDRAVSHL